MIRVRISDHHSIRSSNKYAPFRFRHKAFAKSLSQNLCGPTSWANY